MAVHDALFSPPCVPPSFSNSPTDGQQMIEKLKQLREWQQRQQEQLRVQQQLELVALKRRQESIKNRPNVSPLVQSITNHPQPPSPPPSSPPSSKNMKDTTQEDKTSNNNNNTGSLQPAGHTVSGSSISSNNSADSGMLSGRSSAIDVLRNSGEGEGEGKGSDEDCEHSSGFQTPESDVLSEEEEEERPHNTVIMFQYYYYFLSLSLSLLLI